MFSLAATRAPLRVSPCAFQRISLPAYNIVTKSGSCSFARTCNVSFSRSVPCTPRTANPLSCGTFPTISSMAPASKRQKKDTRCEWSLLAPDYIQYHDEEWGVPLYDDKKMFEFLLLETFQAGLSWLTILRKRDAFANAFHNFDVDLIAAMTEEDAARLQQDAAIVRNKLKIRAAINNAKVVIAMREEGIGFAHYFWNWVDYVPQHNCTSGKAVSKNELSDQIAKDLKKRGFKFVGSTIIYAHLQATGVINDHNPSCPRYKQVQKLLKKKPRK